MHMFIGTNAQTLTTTTASVANEIGMIIVDNNNLRGMKSQLQIQKLYSREVDLVAEKRLL